MVPQQSGYRKWGLAVVLSCGLCLAGCEEDSTPDLSLPVVEPPGSSPSEPFSCGDAADVNAGSPVNLLYHEVGPGQWNTFRNNLISVQDQAFDAQAVRTDVVATVVGANKFHGGVLAPSGEVFFIPSQLSSVFFLDPRSSELASFGDIEDVSNSWAGGVLARDGLVYSLPWRDPQSRLLILNPEDKRVETVPLGRSGYGGQVLAPNGKIYGIPETARDVPVFDPESGEISFIGSAVVMSVPTSGPQLFFGGILAPNGSIYGIPLNATRILKIDPTTDTVSSFGDLPEEGRKWAGGVLTPDGLIFAVPDDASQVLVIDTNNDSHRLLGDFGVTPQKWSFGVFAPNGLVYMIPDDGNTILTIDYRTLEIVEFGDFEGSDKWNGGVLAFDGKIYLIPDSDDRFLRIDLCLESNFDKATVLSTYFNKY